MIARTRSECPKADLIRRVVALTPGYRYSTAYRVSEISARRRDFNELSIGTSKFSRSCRLWVLGTAAPTSCNNAFRYFSAACWQWKHARSRSGGSREARSFAPSQSSSALRTQRFVWRFIEHLALFDHFAQEPIPFLQAALDLVRGPHDQVEREGPLQRQTDANGLTDYVAGRHDDEQIHVALGVRRAIGIRAEKDDLLRLKPLGDLERKTTYGRQGNVRRGVAITLDGGSRWSLRGHTSILPRLA